jgi:hypothetical protein
MYHVRDGHQCLAGTAAAVQELHLPAVGLLFRVPLLFKWQQHSGVPQLCNAMAGCRSCKCVNTIWLDSSCIVAEAASLLACACTSHDWQALALFAAL